MVEEKYDKTVVSKAERTIIGREESMKTIFDLQMAGLTIAPIECQYITDSESSDGADLLVSKGWNHTTLLSVEGNI